jgi:hypothetical protein
MEIQQRVIFGIKRVVTIGEQVLGLGIIAGIAVYAVASVAALVQLDWSSNDTFYELVYRVLLLVIGLELVRTLITHELMAVLELLAFVVARKMLKPDLNVLDILLGVVGFVMLLAARRYFMSPEIPDLRGQNTPPK